MQTETLLLGQTLRFTQDPFIDTPTNAIRHEAQGAVLIRGDTIAEVGKACDLIPRARHANMIRYPDGLILPGFVDAHAHYPQTAIIASWGKRLIDWLNDYTFPEETRFNDPAYAGTIADRYLDLVTAHGTTSVASFCTSHPASVEALFQAAASRDMALVAGKTCMDRNAPYALLDTAQSAYDDSKSLLTRWHGNGRARYAITPRFSPTSTPDQLQALGALWGEHPDCLMQTHISEQQEECAWIADLFPKARDYLDTYEAAGLIGPNALWGHAIWLTDRERARIRETGGTLVHCPTSNTFIGSGLFNVAARRAEGLPLALATDTGGGSSFSMLRTMAAAYEIGQLTGTALHPAQLLWLATEAGAHALNLHPEIGTLEPGTKADLTILDLASTPVIAQRANQAEDIWQALFPTIMMGDDRAIAATWIAGQQQP
ncbi:guanine deaminase [Actibacterium sp. 188UL27-1]|uniref:guanine deaminase n=1 Tax=Actibacterium sp. 188UL27-1 TaxID=2786961 RepID=UPI00195943AD|nr:guanine deaminase [Actibacterium sp. 188UL27-1]MBM7066886.1 guanine deaminase [Actibacterium sp. 188UL27-1]